MRVVTNAVFIEVLDFILLLHVGQHYSQHIGGTGCIHHHEEVFIYFYKTREYLSD